MTLLGNSTRIPGDPLAPADQVREAEAAIKSERKQRVGFSLTADSSFERQLLAPLLTIYLGYTVVRLGEVFPALAVPRLQLTLTETGRNRLQQPPVADSSLEGRISKLAHSEQRALERGIEILE